jgi:hypothetical protein
MPRKTCKRCGYRWVPRLATVRICPACKSEHWDTLRTTDQGLRTDLVEKSLRRPSSPVDTQLQALRGRLADLRREITRRRKANHDERLKHNWNPEAIVTREQTEMLDWIEDQLDAAVRKST